MNPREYAVVAELRGSGSVQIRAIRHDDKQRLAAFFARLSPETIYFRFLGAKGYLSERELTQLTELDFDRQAALVATVERDRVERIVGVARYAGPPDAPGGPAEFAVAVEDAEQNRGIGTVLLKHLLAVAGASGIHRFEAYMLPGNVKLLKLLTDSGRTVRQAFQDGVVHLSF